MIDIRYGVARDSKWHGMVAGSCVLVVERSLGEERLRDLWVAVHDGNGVQSILDALTRGGISTTPAFALASIPEKFGTVPSSISLIVRGSLSVSVMSSTESVQISGEGVSTWTELTVPDALGVEIGSHELANHSNVVQDTYFLNDGSAPVEWLGAGSRSMADSEPDVRSAVVSVMPPLTTPAPIDGSRGVEQPPDLGVTITDPTFVSAATATEPGGGYDFLFGETVVRTVEGAAVRDEQSTPTVSGDHDGRTAIGLSAAERRAARQARAKPATPAAVAPAFFLTFSTGEREPLDQTVIIGRAPSASKVSATSVPRLVTVGGPDQDISRNHVQVTLEGGTVLVTDLHSRNGTMVTLPGRPPQQLRGGQPTAVITGAMVDLGSDVTFTVGEN